jgi:hypothetical protein
MNEMNINKLNTHNFATFLIFLNGIILGLFGLVYSILGTLMPFHEDYIGITASDIRAFNPELMILIGDFVRLIGIYQITIAISGLFILIYGFWKKEKWSWVIFLLYLPMLLLPLLVITYSFSGLLGLPFVSIVLATIFQTIALTISYKEFFK